MGKRFALAALALAASPALAEERDFCGDRPGLGNPACTIDPGHLQIELGLADWTLDRQPDTRTDTIVAGDLLARYGLGTSTEARVGWTAYGHVRTRDRATGDITRQSRTGDISFGLKQNLMNPDGSGTSIALIPTVTVPVGREPVGAGDWGASLTMPTDFTLSKMFQLDFTPEVDAAVDDDGDGRHLAYGTVVGLVAKLSEKLGAALEYSAFRDDDPSGHATMELTSLSVTYMTDKDTQLDAGAVAGLDHEAPDAELYFGVSRRF